MRALSGVRPLVRATMIGVLLASGLALGGPVQGGGEGPGPYMSAFTAGQAGCSGNPPLGPDDCRSWEEQLATGSASSWELDKEVGLTVSGGAMAAKGTANAVELDNADETLGSLTLTATLEATLTGGGNGAARLDFTANFPVSSETISVIGQASVEGHGTAIIGGSGDIEVTVGCAEEPELQRRLQVLGGAHGGEAGRLNDDAKSESINATVTALPQADGSRFCSMRVFMDAQAGTNRANPGSEHGSGKATISLTILAGGAAPSATPSLGDCALAGTVLDGDFAADGHANKLAGIRVELLKDGAVLGSPVGTGQDGRYCMPWDAVPQAIPGTADAGSYELRATLIDMTHQPPVFHTEHQDSQEPISVLFDVDGADWGVASVELPFTQTDTRPWLPDIANIHWQSARFVDWVLDVLQVPPADIGGFRIRAFDPEGSHYTRSDNVAHIGDDDSAFDTRNTALSDNPENGEWHEIAHHLGRILGVAPFGTAVACQGRSSHGGWTNASTCDSLGEAFAMYVSTIASLELDLGVPGGYATPNYAGFGSSEDNDWAPWSSEPGPGTTRIYREDLGVMRLLWDLQDDTPSETAVTVARSRSGGALVGVTVHDRIALGGTNLIGVLASLKPETVADVYDFLSTTSTIDASLRTPTVDIDGDGSADLSAIDEVFLMHDIRPLGTTGLYEVGSQLGHTPPGAAGLADRRNLEHVAGSVLRLVNTGTGVATFTVSITSESGASAFTIPVAPGATLDIPTSLGPYSNQPLPEGAALPACGAEGARVSTLAVSGPGGVSESVDNCDFSHRVVATAADGAALTVTAAGSEPGASGVPAPGPGASGGGVPIIVIVGIVIVALVVAGGVLLFVRRRNA
jgi:hypothetical protein